MGHDKFNDGHNHENILRHYGHGGPDQNHGIPKTTMPVAHDSKRLAFRNKIGIASDKLKEDCCHHLLLDIYLHALPMDDGCAEQRVGRYSDDVDKMLSSSGQTAAQYFKSAASTTGAPLLEFVNRSVDTIAKLFTEEAEAKLAADEAEDIETTDADIIPDDDNIDSQLVDIKSDTEYEDFVTKLKQKTIKKIVADISNLIADKRDDKEMTFAPKLESAFIQGMNHISNVMLKNGSDVDFGDDEVIELAVRESTIFTMNEAFCVGERDLSQFGNRLRMNKGNVLVESAIVELTGIDVPDQRDLAYNAIIMETQKFLDDSIAEFHFEGVKEIGAAVGKSIKWLIDKIIAMCRKVKNMITNAMMPRIEKDIKTAAKVQNVKNDAMRKIGYVSSEKKTKPSVSSKKSTATSSEHGATIDKQKASMLAGNAYDNITLVRNGNTSQYSDMVVRYNDNGKIINTKVMDAAIVSILLPAIRKGFKSGTISHVIDEYGAEGNIIRILHVNEINTLELCRGHLALIDRIESVINSPDVAKLINQPDVDPYLSKLLNGLYSFIITLNNELQGPSQLVANLTGMPFSKDELAHIKTPEDLAVIVNEFLTPGSGISAANVFGILQYIIKFVATQNDWALDGLYVGASRCVIIPKNSKNVYKYAWNRKGVVDNKRDQLIASRVTGTPLAKYFALPISGSTSDGAMVVVPRANEVNPSPDEVSKFVDTFHNEAKAAGISLTALDIRDENLGKLNGHMVFIDYANFNVH